MDMAEQDYLLLIDHHPLTPSLKEGERTAPTLSAIILIRSVLRWR